MDVVAKRKIPRPSNAKLFTTAAEQLGLV